MTIESVSAEVKTQCASWIIISDSLTTYIQQVIAKAEVAKGDIKRTAIATLFCKIVNSFFAARTLLEDGYVQDSGTVVRSLIEALFVMKACQNSPKFLDQYMRTDIKALDNVHQKHARYVERMKRSGLMTDEDGLKYKADHEKALGEYSGLCGVELNLYRAAELAELLDMYDIVYIHLSTLNSHPSIRSLGSRMVLDEHGELIEFSVGPEAKGADWMFSVLLQPVIVALACVDEEFSIGINNDIREAWESYNRERDALVLS